MFRIFSAISRFLLDKYSKKIDLGKPVQWGKKYRQYLEKITKAMAERYDNNPNVEAVLMMSGGNYGEMSQTPMTGYKWDANPDVKDVNNIFIKEMALETGESAKTLTKPYFDPKALILTDGARKGNTYVARFDYYYALNTKRLIDIYMRHFKNKPVVLQVGSGASGDGKIAEEVVRYAVQTYGNRVWLKQNGWGDFFLGDYYNSLFGQFKTKTRVTREVGHLWDTFYTKDMSYKTDRNNNPITVWQALDLYKKTQNQRYKVVNHNYYTIKDVVDIGGTSCLCFQSQFFVMPNDFPTNIQRGAWLQVSFKNGGTYLADALRRNYESYYKLSSSKYPNSTSERR